MADCLQLERRERDSRPEPDEPSNRPSVPVVAAPGGPILTVAKIGTQGSEWSVEMHLPSLRRQPREAVVSAGRVWCPRRGDIDVERCGGCPAYRGSRPEGAHEIIRCDLHWTADPWVAALFAG